MAEEWKRAEVLLEEIGKDVKAIAEGYSILNRKIDAFRDEVQEQFQEVRRSLPPAHVSV